MPAEEHDRQIDEIMEAQLELDVAVNMLDQNNVPAAVFHIEHAIEAAKRAHRKIVKLLA
jgi:hypothetical protein